METSNLDENVRAVRRFSRFYTRRIGVLHEGLFGSDLTLTEARIVYDLAQAGETTAARLAAALDLDPGYLSRLLRGFHDRDLVARRPSPQDGRESLLSLSETGRALFAAIDRRSQDEVAALIARLPEPAQRRLVTALATAEALLDGAAAAGEPAIPCLLRSHQPGDIGWIVHRQGVLYNSEYGWDERFEALVAEIVAAFVQNFDPARERCWIAERHAEVVGSVFVVRESDEVAKLRLLYVEPSARGIGIGRRLVDECIGFARRIGYRRITLWTNDVLIAARRIYQQAGFQLVSSEPHHSFGHDLVGENWVRDL